MIPWWVALIALIVGEIVGVVIPRFCAVNRDEEPKCKYIK